MNKVFYGEYSLEYWIQLMLKKKIILPEYQRIYRWEEKDINGLIKSFRESSFIPPVTVGHYVDREKGSQDLILDGQQRLTSLLLAYLGIFPLRGKDLDKVVDKFADENDEDEEILAEEESLRERFRQWRYDKLLDYGSTRREIVEAANADDYKKLVLKENIDEDLLKNTYLGFSYIVPDNSSENGDSFEVKQTKYYATVFQSINSTGVALEDQESRAALYYLDKSIKKFFQPDFSSKIKVSKSGRQIDFVRSLSLVSELSKALETKNISQAKSRIAVGLPRNNFEDYYRKFIKHTIENHVSSTANNTQISEVEVSSNLISVDETSRVYDFKEMGADFWRNEWEDKIDSFYEILGRVKGDYNFDSIIELDIYTFGLIHFIIMNENFRPENLPCEEIRDKIFNIITSLTHNHRRNPNRVTFIRERLELSHAVYSSYFSSSIGEYGESYEA